MKSYNFQKSIERNVGFFCLETHIQHCTDNKNTYNKFITLKEVYADFGWLIKLMLPYTVLMIIKGAMCIGFTLDETVE